MGKRCRKLISLLTALALVLASIGVAPVKSAKAAEYDTFTLYYYAELEEGYDSVYMDIWSHSGLEFADTASTSAIWGWTYSQGVLEAVEGNENWYAIDVKILDGADSDGFDLYQAVAGETASSKLGGYDASWNNTEIYASLISGENSAYAIKDGVVYTDLSDAGISLTYDEFTLYYYTELGEDYDSVYMNIWNHDGLEFADTVTTDSAWGWGNSQGIFEELEGNENWYTIDVKVLDGADGDGFTVYHAVAGDTASSEVAGYDIEWNNTEIYTTLISKSYNAYAIKDGAVYTDLSEAGISTGEVVVTVDDVISLMETVPEDYESMGFTEDSVTAMTTALEAAGVITEENSNAEIKAAYEALQNALDGLVFDADLFVTQIDGYDEDESIRGVDVSSYLSIMDAFEALRASKEEAGASQEEIDAIGFKDWDGNVLDEQGFFDLLAASGVNSVRIRVWNDPYNSETGVGYGGGNNDIDKAVEMGQYVTNAGMTTLIDFHFSDFWADPGKQKAPKAWAEYTVEEKADAVSTFVTDSLTQLIDEGVDVSMVQIGNETNGKFCGESTFENMNILFDAGCDAVKAVDEDILNVIHFTNPESAGRLAGYAENLAAYDGDGDSENEGVSYDVFATSYYPYWHGDIANLKNVLTPIAQTYDKYVLVAETSWANTWTDGDGHENTIMEQGDLGDYVDYLVTLQGQATAIRNVASAMNDIAQTVTLSNGEKAGLGFYYWEPAWIPVESVVDENGEAKEDYDEILASNKEIWENTGSGWAAQAASEYDPDDAGMWHGGSAVDNQAVFDFDGNPLSTLNMFKYFRFGAQAAEVVVDGYTSVARDVMLGETVDAKLPATIEVIYNDSSKGEESVSWNQDDIDVVNAAAESVEGLGTYVINGTLTEEDDYAVVCTVDVIPENLLADSSFENAESSWSITGSGAAITSDDPMDGSKSLHFYYSADFAFKAECTTTVTEAGYYNASINMQGLASSGSRDGESLVLRAATGDGTEYVSENVTLNGWLAWQEPLVEDIYVSQEMIDNGENTITLIVDAAFLAEAWGTMDCAYLYLNVAEEEVVPSASPSIEPSAQPSVAPSTAPSTVPSVEPSAQPGDTTEKEDAKAPAKVKNVKVKASAKKMTISWKQVVDVKGYEIHYSTSKKFKKASTKKVTIKKQKTTSKTVKKLKSGKKYYVKVRAYTVVDGEKVYGKWSKVVSKKVK